MHVRYKLFILTIAPLSSKNLQCLALSIYYEIYVPLCITLTVSNFFDVTVLSLSPYLHSLLSTTV